MTIQNRREFLKKMGAGAAALALPGCTSLSSGPPAKRPNILFIMTDDHACQATSCYGSRLNETPNIDRLAREGARFDNAFCTNSICAPSRAVLLTGKYSHLNGHINNAVTFDGSQQTFVKLLRGVGYETAVIGKWHLKSDPTGFDYWNILPGQGDYYNPLFIEMGEKKKKSGYVTDLITDTFLDWLDGRDGSKPFCALLHHKAPHRNWMPGPDHLDLYRDKDLPVPETFFDDYATRSGAAREQEMRIADHMYMAYDLKLPPGEKKDDETGWEKADRRMWKRFYGRLDEAQKKAWDEAYGEENRAFREAGLTGEDLELWKYQRYVKDYLRCVASVDDNIGRVLDALDRMGLSDDTVVVYTSDQGFYLGEHGWYDKRFIYEESLRMPLVVRYPREIDPRSCPEEMVMNLDFAPTFLDYAGVKIPGDMQGRSMRRVLRGDEPSDWRQAVYYHYYEYPGAHQVKRHYGVRTHRYKLIHFYHDIDAWELYDLKEDPQELRNVYGDPAYAKVQTELEAELERLRRLYGDTDSNRYMPLKIRKKSHKALGCPATLKHPCSPKYKGGGPGALTDGLGAPEGKMFNDDYALWQGFEQSDFEAVVDLGQPRKVNGISAGFLQHTRDWIFLPSEVEIELSGDGKIYVQAMNARNTISMKKEGIFKHSFKAGMDGLDARYVKVKARNVGICPDWHPGAGGNAWLFIDEIYVE